MAMAEPPLPPSPAPAPMSAASSARPILLMVGSVLAFAIMDALVKDLGTRYPTMQVMFFRSIFAFVPILLVVLHSRSLQALRMHSPIGHLLRSLVGVVAMFCFFYAYSRMPLAEAVAIGFRSEEHTSELQSLMRISYAVFCLKKKN